MTFREKVSFRVSETIVLHTPPDPPDPADPADRQEVVSATAARSLPSTRAGGQDDGSLTNSLKPIGTA